ncbi:MAG TPA: YtxH domain-containing protein [Candidatus Saccharimonadales bacterium]|nr:YtxH domain-containing protein [Candidatus Saccharimonadales bacterium]
MKDRSKKFALGTIFAAIGGYVAGVLTAPKSGKETRQDIKNVTEAELQKVRQELDEVLVKAKNLGASAKEQALKNANDARNKVHTLLANTKAASSNDQELKNAAHEAREALKHLKEYLAQYGKAAKDSFKK